MKALVVDDHVLIREAVRGVLIELMADAAIIDASNSQQAMRRIEENPDLELILLDLKLPDGSGFEVLSSLRARYPAISVVILSASSDRDDIARALELGAVGFIPKSAQREVMLSALKLILSGGVYVPPEILHSQQAPYEPSQTAASERSSRPPSATEIGLTSRQMEVLALMMQGKSNKAICRVLDLAEPTVKNHVTAVLKALKVSNRTEAVIAAGTLGLAPPRGTG